MLNVSKHNESFVFRQGSTPGAPCVKHSLTAAVQNS